MSLLDDFAHTCVLLEKQRIPSPEGGWKTVWTDGAQFENTMALDTSIEARIAEKQGMESVYSALVRIDFPIEYNDVFRDLKTGLTYRVTSDPKEKEAPKSSTYQVKYFTAERFQLPSDNEPLEKRQ